MAGYTHMKSMTDLLELLVSLKSLVERQGLRDRRASGTLFFKDQEVPRSGEIVS